MKTKNNVFNPENIQPGDFVKLRNPSKDDPRGKLTIESVGGKYNNKVFCKELDYELYATCFKKVKNKKVNKMKKIKVKKVKIIPLDKLRRRINNILNSQIEDLRIELTDREEANEEIIMGWTDRAAVMDTAKMYLTNKQLENLVK